LSSQSRARMLHIADCAISEIAEMSLGRRIAVLATEGTIRSGFYQRKLSAAGYIPVVPSSALQSQANLIIKNVKKGLLVHDDIAAMALRARLKDLNADAAILACTELPIVWQSFVEEGGSSIPNVNATLCLARGALKALGYDQPMKARLKID